MLTFRLNERTKVDEYLKARVVKVINENKGYIKKFNSDWEEASNRIYLHMITHADQERIDDLLPYFKRLAQTIMQKRNNETTHKILEDLGEASNAFEDLQVYDSSDSLNDSAAILTEFKDLYLMYPENFKKLRSIFEAETDTQKFTVEERVKEEQMKSIFKRIIHNYGTSYTYKYLGYFFNNLHDYTNTRVTGKTKVVLLRESDFTLTRKIPETPTIKDENGRMYAIDPLSLTMKKDPDYFKWGVLTSTQCDILKIDLSEYMDEMYKRTMVEQGVDTDIVKWCDDRCSLTTPGGTKRVGLERNKFLALARQELVLSLIGGNIGSIVAISEDYLYIKPNRIFQYDKVELRTNDGRRFTIPIDMHIPSKSKRKG